MRQLTAFGYYLIAFSVIFIMVQLGWQWLQGGINAHHLLANPNLPAVSDAWGLLIISGLAWLAARRLQHTTNQAVFWYSLLLGFGYGGLLALLYLNGISQPVALLFFGTYFLALLLPLHRAEIVLGYVAALSLAFGAVLPLLMSSPAILIAWLAAKGRRWLQQRRLLRQA
ncbi:hypothetical protein Q3O60_04210 [Alkalimonas collagenimarina]|uniref:Uncharacterized protein n=1 Tax=Alkalimonas collagenimarina TaxID=400390 RepID=A0ABT9GWH0_9GAMM|nr:hypothetical protein [Alkalimonas collagenimarina]MDP4535391.1 hypothetical protein [Alkalimonas collagenimarina]